MHKKKIAVAVTGASGAIYARLLLNELSRIKENIDSCCVVFSENAIDVWKYELETDPKDSIIFPMYSDKDFHVPIASGSSGFDALVVCPCSMGTLGRIANGISDSLITRAADVMLKERKTLILVTRETPLNLIHIKNMETISSAGAIICPAMPSFYSKPTTIEELAMTVVNRILSLLELPNSTKAWGE